jgi:hypothetical protein
MMAKSVADGNQMKEEGLFEYHLYTLDRPTTLKENQTKQVALLAARNIPVRKEYTLAGADWYYRERAVDLGDKLKVAVYVAFDNRAEANLGLPLPKGVVRVYQRDGAGRPQFVGEDAIDHTPKNEKVRLRLGDAFDVTARRRQTDFKSLGAQGQYRYAFETAFQIDLKNAKKEPVTVAVLDPCRATGRSPRTATRSPRSARARRGSWSRSRPKGAPPSPTAPGCAGDRRGGKSFVRKGDVTLVNALRTEHE